MEKRFKVFVADPIHADGLARLRERFEVVYLGPDAGDAEKDVAAESADAIVVRLYKITPALLKRCPSLKAVIKHGIGVDNIDIDAATQHGAIVANTPAGPNAPSVAEGAVALILATMRKLRERHEAVLDNRFMESRNGLVTNALWGKTVGLVGFGQIGRIAGRICARGFDCKVLAFDPWAPADVFEAEGVKRVDALDDLLREADVVSVHAPLTPETRGLIGARELESMKRDAIIVNTARGGIIDEDALAAALAGGVIAGAGIDVFADEPPAPDAPLLAAPNLVLTPHVAGMSQDSLRELGMAVATAVEEAADGQMPATTLNAAAWSGIEPTNNISEERQR